MGRRAALFLLLGLAACDRDQPKESPPAEERSEDPAVPALEVAAVIADAARAPRDGGPLIAGEEARVSLRVLGGEPPYQIELTALRQDRGPPGPAPIEATFEIEPEGARAGGVETAIALPLDRAARSGVYRVRAKATDRAGREATARSGDFRVVGEGAELLPARGEPPHLEVTGAGGRRRARFYRGERVTVRARLEGAETASVAVLDPRGRELARSADLPLEGGVLSLPFDIPRLAPPGHYRVRVRAGDRAAATRLRVAGPAFPPAKELAIDRLVLYGGADLRDELGAELPRGAPVRVEARIGGARRRVRGTLRLRQGTGEPSFEADLGAAAIRNPAPDVRIFVTGEVVLPSTLAPGRHMLEIEVTEGEDVSTRYREVLVR